MFMPVYVDQNEGLKFCLSLGKQKYEVNGFRKKYIGLKEKYIAIGFRKKEIFIEILQISPDGVYIKNKKVNSSSLLWHKFIDIGTGIIIVENMIITPFKFVFNKDDPERKIVITKRGFFKKGKRIINKDVYKLLLNNI